MKKYIFDFCNQHRKYRDICPTKILDEYGPWQISSPSVLTAKEGDEGKTEISKSSIDQSDVVRIGDRTKSHVFAVRSAGIY